MSSVEFWRGDGGKAYTLRQPQTTRPSTFLRSLLKPWLPEIHTVLEVGCNRGDNLDAFYDKNVTGVEPAPYARELARKRGWNVRNATADDLPFRDKTFDLVLTVGVLIHVPPERLSRSICEIVRVSRKFILAVEYDAPTPTPIDYRGQRAGIWKRPYGSIYGNFHDVIQIATGPADEFDGCRYWLFRK